MSCCLTVNCNLVKGKVCAKGIPTNNGITDLKTNTTIAFTKRRVGDELSSISYFAKYKVTSLSNSNVL